MTDFFEKIFGSQVWALLVKETREILRSKYLLFLILFPPTIELLIIGASLDPQVRNLTLGLVDYSNSMSSREFSSAISSSQIFPKAVQFNTQRDLGREIENGNVAVGVVIPPDFSESLSRGTGAKVQVIIDGADAYAAGIASADMIRIIDHFQPSVAGIQRNPAISLMTSTIMSSSMQHKSSGLGDDTSLKNPVEEIPGMAGSVGGQPVSSMTMWSTPTTSGAPSVPMYATGWSSSQAQDANALIDARIQLMYNAGLLASWFFVPGVLGATLTLTATLVASAAVLRERESGTMDQLLMTPAETWQILLAKILPLVVFLMADVLVAILACEIVFNLPFRGDIILFIIGSLLYIVVGIAMGMLLGTLCKNQRQSQLCSFFINIPLIQLSGTVVPYDTMPPILQVASALDPLRYYSLIARGVILKGVGWDILWPDVLCLIVFAVAILAVTMTRFNRQIA